MSLPGIGHVAATRCELVAPSEFGLTKSTARSELPFGFGRQLLAGPGRIGSGVPVRDVHDRIIVEAAYRAAFAVGMAPVGTKLERPPIGEVAQVHRMIGRAKNQRARLQHVRERAWVILSVGRDLGEGDVVGRLDEFAKFAVGDWR